MVRNASEGQVGGSDAPPTRGLRPPSPLPCWPLAPLPLSAQIGRPREAQGRGQGHRFKAEQGRAPPPATTWRPCESVGKRVHTRVGVPVRVDMKLSRGVPH